MLASSHPKKTPTALRKTPEALRKIQMTSLNPTQLLRTRYSDVSKPWTQPSDTRRIPSASPTLEQPNTDSFDNGQTITRAVIAHAPVKSPEIPPATTLLRGSDTTNTATLLQANTNDCPPSRKTTLGQGVFLCLPKSRSVCSPAWRLSRPSKF